MKVVTLLSGFALFGSALAAATPDVAPPLVARHSGSDVLPFSRCGDLRRYYKEYNGNTKKIAEKMNVPENTVKEYISQSKANKKAHQDKPESYFNKEQKCYLS